MLEHFGLRFRNSEIGYKLTRENYVRISKKSSFETNDFYDEDYCREHAIDSLINFDYNMDFFAKLNKKAFNSEINHFLRINPQFKAVVDLNKYKNKQGFYLMVLDEYCQAYIGGAQDICKRIRKHWTNQKSFDRLIFGDIDSSIISIDSFRHLDTTRLYAHVIDDTFTAEDRYINSINPLFMCNRTIGGLLEGGLQEAIANRKERELKGKDLSLENIIKYADNLDPSPVQLHEIYFKVNGNGFLENLKAKYEEYNIIQRKYSGKYGVFTFDINLSEKVITVIDIS